MGSVQIGPVAPPVPESLNIIAPTPKMASGYYWGNNDSPKAVNIGFSPTYVLIWHYNNSYSGFPGFMRAERLKHMPSGRVSYLTSKWNGTNPNYFIGAIGTTKLIEITSTGFEVSEQLNLSDSKEPYYYLAF